MKKILLVASEMFPFVASGGLGDVMGSLPKALKKHYGDSGDIRVAIPLHGKIGGEWREKFRRVSEFCVRLSWRQQYCGILAYQSDGVTYYFIDNEYYFSRDSLYGQHDDGERYAYFCRAVLDMMPRLGFFPDVLHANDWHTALAVVYLKRKYCADPSYAAIRTVFTIHNIEYQGIFGHEILSDVLDLEPAQRDLVDYDGDVNLMKGAIVCCDKLTTVSPTYAAEIRHPYFSGHLAGIIRENEYKLCGIINGIDTDYYDPSTDGEIRMPYSAEDLAGKQEDKADLQRIFSLPEDPSIPLVAIVSRLAAHKGFDLVMNVFEEILQRPLQFVVLGTGERKYEGFFSSMVCRYPSKLGLSLSYNKTLAKQVYAGSDMFLMPSKSEPCGLAQMIAATYGSVPIVHSVGGLADTIKPFEADSLNGNGITFRSYNAHDMMYAVDRAVNLYSTDAQRWHRLVQNAMKSDFTWSRSARGYAEIYDSI